MNKNNGTFFNKMAKNWDKNIPTLNYEIVCSIIEKFQIGPKCSVLNYIITIIC